MKYVKLYETWEQPTRPIVSFDFDGTLHDNPCPDCMELGCLNQITVVLRKLMDEAMDNDIVIVTKNPEENKQYIIAFVEAYGLPVTEIYCTNRMSKKPTLLSIGAVRHYDDRDMTDELADTGIEFVQVDPRSEEIDEKEEKVWLEIKPEKIRYYESVLKQAPLRYKFAISVLDSVKGQDGKITARQKAVLDDAMTGYPDPRRWGPRGN
jgi:hypothetical protein